MVEGIDWVDVYPSQSSDCVSADLFRTGRVTLAVVVSDADLN